MTKINCLIVDDQQLGRDMLESYTERISALNLLHKCKSAKEAKTWLAQEKVDLIFLDIQMPRLSGVEFLKQLKNPPAVIFTTAYTNYALAGYELNIVDYLLKPISFDRFEKAVNKALDQLELESKACAFDQQEHFEENFILVHADHQHHKVFLKDIVYIESLKEYVRYHSIQGKLLELNALKKVAQQLPKEHFMQIHRSYIVALEQVQSYKNGKLVLKTGLELPIGKTYKKEVVAKLFK